MNDALENVAAQFRRLPGIGVKTARRLAYFMLERPESEVADFIAAIETARKESCYCSVCCNLAVSDPCGICADPRRDRARHLRGGTAAGCAGPRSERRI